MIDESKYPTMRMLVCQKCKNVFAASLTGSMECPECGGDVTVSYTPEKNCGKKKEEGGGRGCKPDNAE